MSIIEQTKFKVYLVQVAKGFKLGLIVLISMILMSYWSGEFNGEDLLFCGFVILGAIPAFIFMTLAYALLEVTKFHKFTRSLLWSIVSAIVIVTLVNLVGFIEPPFMSYTTYSRYVAFFTVILILLYYQLPWKEEQ